MDIKVNRKIYRDKVLACWIGKNIGGTMGAPYEGNPNIQDIKCFSTPKGEPLPNDDLDLQLVWLKALKEVGAKGLDANALSWFWRRYINGIWNEYGVGQNNISIGITPPMSGELYNDGWKTSNGAWIRSEIWACLAPAHPNISTKYAIMDASVDHGVSEGTFAEIFTAALESMAFSENNIRTLIEKSLTYIPNDCLVSKYVKTVINEYDKGTDWKGTRAKIIELNKELGFFHAPGNLAFVVLGLLYGEGDFLKSLIYAINCGDDTDCTGATVGAILGIVGGVSAIPNDLKEYIGERIVTCALDVSFFLDLPKNCTELTDDVMRFMPLLMGENGCFTEYTDSEDSAVISQCDFECNGYTHEALSKKPLSIEKSNYWVDASISFDHEPRISHLSDLAFDVTINNKSYNLYQLNINVLMPEGWKATYPKSMVLHHHTGAHDSNNAWRPLTNCQSKFTVTITAGENVAAINKVYVAVEALGYPEPLIIPITILG